MSEAPLPLTSIARQLKGEEHRLSQLLTQLGVGLDARPEVWRALVERAVVCLHWAQDAILTAATEKKESPQADPGAALPENGSGPAQGHAVGGLSSVVPVFSAMQILCELEKDGALRVDAGEQTFEVLLEGGRVVYAHGDRPAPGERLGEILVRHAVLTEAELHEALQRAKTEGKSVGTLLIRDGLVSPEQLTTALTEQALAVFVRMHTAGGARWYFEERAPGEEPRAGRIEPAQLAPREAQATDSGPGPEVSATDAMPDDAMPADEIQIIESESIELDDEMLGGALPADEIQIIESEPIELDDEMLGGALPADELRIIESEPIELDDADPPYGLGGEIRFGAGE